MNSDTDFESEFQFDKKFMEFNQKSIKKGHDFDIFVIIFERFRSFN